MRAPNLCAKMLDYCVLIDKIWVARDPVNFNQMSEIRFFRNFVSIEFWTTGHSVSAYLRSEDNPCYLSNRLLLDSSNYRYLLERIILVDPSVQT